jgi:pentatricopeptide repeat protein
MNIRHLLQQTSSPSEDKEQQQGQRQRDPFGATGSTELVTTLKGGLSVIFEMAQKYNAEEDEEEKEQGKEVVAQKTTTDTAKPTPRWHPHSGIESENPNFRTCAPAMSNSGFAKSIWRNVRKRNKPALWQNALRTYIRMGILEERQDMEQNIKRSNIHHEGAMLACSKLGLWQKCLEIYHLVNEQDTAILPPTASRTQSSQSSNSGISAKASKMSRRVYITDNMIQSLIRACTRASNQRATKYKGNHELSEEEAALRRIPLDTALEILRTQEENHSIPVAANHVNPLAAAYQSLGYVEQARDILQNMLSNRTAGEEPEDGIDILNIHDLHAKDKGSYSLMVQGAVGSGDWAAAVEALGDMTRAGLYPNSRHYNSWNELSERHRRRSWKKKRDKFWVDSVR